MTTSTKTAVVRQLQPLLAVHDIQRSIAFYRDQLGFNLKGQAEKEGKIFWCIMERDGVTIMLQQDEDEDGPAESRGCGVSFYFLCEDADVIYAELISRGLKLNPPVVAYYGMKQVVVPEPDGYYLCFESPVKSSGS